MAHAITLHRTARHALRASLTPAGAAHAHLLLTTCTLGDPRREEHVRVSAVLDVQALHALRALIDAALGEVAQDEAALEGAEV